jgi:nucleoid-associated protein YgaU
MGRYKNILKVNKAKDNVPLIRIDSKPKQSDMYITYRSEDRLDLISSRIYGKSEFYWVILEANGYSLEFDIEPGEILRVPYPLFDYIGSMR